MQTLEKELIVNPKLGADLGNGIFKIRLAVKSKGKGKSGGYRVITYHQIVNQINMIYNLMINQKKQRLRRQIFRSLLKSGNKRYSI